MTASTISGNSVGSGNLYGFGIATYLGALTVTNSTISANNSGRGILSRDTSTVVTNSIISGNSGGGIRQEGATLSVADSEISGNLAGGIGISSGTIATVTNSIISRNANPTWNGGGIGNGGTLTVTNSIISGNSAAAGGGIRTEGASAKLTVENSTISDNSAVNGGGISNYHWGTVIVVNSTISRNSSAGRGGGIFSYGTLTLTNSTVSGNSSNSGGGGICNYSGSMATVTSSTISGNSAAQSGGGILNEGTLEVSNSTISGNSAVERDGGGIHNYSGTLTVTNTTISDNFAGARPGYGVGGGGIRVYTGAATLHNSIVATNVRPTSVPDDVYGVFQSSSSYNLIGAIDGSVGLISSGTLYGSRAAPLDPKLGPLQDNGGPTFTQALLPGSPAIDAGTNAFAPPTDQRGFARIFDGNRDGVATIDIGAFELTNSPPVADASGPYWVVTGLSVQLNASASTDPDEPPDTLIFRWDFDADGRFGETGSDAKQGDEIGITPTFSSAGLPAPSMVTVALRVTDSGGLSWEDTAQIEIYGADLVVNSWDIAFAPVPADSGEPVMISATIANQGVADASGIAVSFFAFDSLIGAATIPSLAAGRSAGVFIETTFDTPGLRLITVKVDPGNTIRELNEANNEASALLQVGEGIPSSEAEIVVAVPAHTAYEGSPVVIHGEADYDFAAVPGEQDFPVQGAQVTVTVIDPGTSQVLGVYAGAKTDVNGSFSQWILAPVDEDDQTDTYTLLVEITDNTLTTRVESTLEVIEQAAPVQPPSPPGGPVRDVSVYSDNIFFTDENPDPGEPITIFAFVGYVGQEAAEDVRITINDIFPVAGNLRMFPIGTTLVDFPASPDGAIVAVTMPWTNTADGAHIIQVVAEPGFSQYTGNDRATRLISVGSVVETLEISKDVRLALDPDGNGPTPGDTLAYKITYENAGESDLTGAVLLDGYDELLLQTPFDISDDGRAEDGSILWDLGTLAAGASGSVTYLVQVKPVEQFPAGVVTVVNTAILDTQQTAPLAAMAEIDVTGDTIPPETTATVTPEPNAAGWNNTDVTVILSAEDNDGGSGVSKIVYSIDGAPEQTIFADTVALSFADEGVHAIAFYAVDMLSNAESPQTILVKVDKWAPTITATLDKSAAATGWYNVATGAPTATFVGQDSGSGVASISGPYTFGEGTHLWATGTVTDVAGNSTTQSFFDVFVDLTAPVAVHDGPFVVNEGSTIQLDGRASWDALSRLKSTAWSIHGDGVFDDGDPAFFSALDGPSTHVVLLRVEDVAGNEATVTTEVIVMNVPPVAVDDAYGVDEDNLLIIAAPGVLGNDSDVGADSLTAILVAGPANGTLVLNSDGSFTYTPDANFNGTDSFTYRAFDGDDYSNEATVTIAVRSVIDAVIDIKPGSEPNSINLGSKGVLPVAILSTQRAKGELEDLDARLVDVATILFGDARSGYGRVAPIRSAVEDVDGDGDLDLILHFDMEQIVGNRALDADSVDAVLSAEIFGGPAGGFDLIGFDHLSIVPSGNGKKKG